MPVVCLKDRKWEGGGSVNQRYQTVVTWLVRLGTSYCNKRKLALVEHLTPNTESLLSLCSGTSD